MDVLNEPEMDTECHCQNLIYLIGMSYIQIDRLVGGGGRRGRRRGPMGTATGDNNSPDLLPSRPHHLLFTTIPGNRRLPTCANGLEVKGDWAEKY